MLRLVALALLALLLAPAAAVGHADLRSITSAPDAQPGTTVLRLAFGAAVEPRFASVVARDATGADRVARVEVDPLDPAALIVVLDAAAGPERVEWRVLSIDGHVTEGSGGLPAGVAHERDRDPLAAILGRALAMGSALALLGLVAVRWGVAAPAARSGGLDVGVPAALRAQRRARAEQALAARMDRWWRAWWAAVVLGILGVVLLAGATAASLGAGDDLARLVGDTRPGRAWTAEILMLMLATAGAAVMARRGRARDPAAGEGWALALGAPPVVALAAISRSGHAGSGGGGSFDVGADLLHNLATGAWLGGLVGLAALVLPVALTLPADERVQFLAPAIVRFSGLAVTAVAVLVVTGVYRALGELSGLGDLVSTAYGRVLLVKLVVFGVMLAVGAYNRLVLHPRLERAALGLTAGDRGAGTALRVSIRAELALAAAVLLSVAVLVAFPPPA